MTEVFRGEGQAALIRLAPPAGQAHTFLMKIAVLLISLAMFWIVTPLQAADECCENRAASIQKRIREIDLNIALKKYEQVSAEKAKAELQLILLETSVDLSESDRNQQSELIQKRIHILGTHANDIRNHVRKLSEEVAVASK